MLLWAAEMTVRYEVTLREGSDWNSVSKSQAGWLRGRLWAPVDPSCCHLLGKFPSGISNVYLIKERGRQSAAFFSLGQ